MTGAADRAARLILWLLLGGLAAAGAHYALTKSMHQDVAYYVNAVERWLDGARLYRDLIDVNVPTVYWLMAAPVWVARRLDVPSTIAFNLFVLALATLSVGTVWSLARRGLRNPGWLPDALAGVLLLWFVALVGHDFGQREHLATILLAPYAVARAAAVGDDRARLWVRIAIGLCAGIGLALKPYFALILLGMEGALLLRRGRDWRPSAETAALVLAAGACAAATVLLVPAYLDRVVPLARATYHGFEWPVATVIGWQGPRTFGSFAIALLCIPLAWAMDRRQGDLAAVLSGAALGGFASFLIQSKGWLYQLTPALTYSFAAFAVAAAALGSRWLSGRGRAATALLSVCLGILLAAILLEFGRLYGSDAALRERQAPLVEALREHAQEGPALFISLDVDYTFPGVNYAGAAYPYRWHHLLPLPGLYRDFVPGPEGRLFRAPAEMGPIERDFFESFVADALAHPPRIVLVDRRRPVRPGLSPELDLLAYFCQSAPFAELMSGFDWLGRRGTYDVLIPRAGAPSSHGPCGAPRPQFPVAANS
ncbi:MAG: hypothetical protein K0S81_1007 [Rhodospirillales bacterium]|nr:hypothetical protein [Rhodospirillales bacterium]